MHISYAELIARRLPLTAAESAALVIAVAAACEREQLATPPRAEHIVLHADGTVTFGHVDQWEWEEPIRALAALLYRLLGLDTDGERPRHAEIPGALMLMLARVRGEIDLPAPSARAFLEALARLASADRATLAAVYARVVPAQKDTPDTSAAAVAEQSQITAAVPERSGRLRHAWFTPAAAFAAGCAVALTFVVVTGWRPAGPVTAPAAMLTQANLIREGTREPRMADANAASVPNTSDRTPDRDPTASTDSASATSGFALDPIGRSPTPLIARTLTTDAFSPSFGSDGELVFHLGRTDGRLMKASIARDGAVSVTPLVDDAAANFHGVISPDGRRLAFDSDREGTRGVYVAEADGTAARRVSGKGFATTPSWSPDGMRLAFVKSEETHPRVWNVWIADLESGTLTRVSHHRVGQAWRPSWFPDGRRLVYSVEDDLVITDLVRRTSRLIRSPERGRLVRTPAVSPDGRRVVFQVFGNGVWLFDLASGRMHRVLADRTAEEFAWSPDGKRIAFHTRRAGHWSLWQLAL